MDQVALPRCTVAVGGLGLRLAGAAADVLGPAWAPFVVAPDAATVSCISIHHGPLPRSVAGAPVAQGDLWRLWHDERERRLCVYLRGSHRRPDRALRCDGDWRACELHVAAGSPDPNPLVYPLDQLLWLHLLQRHGGVLLHAAGVALDGRTVALVGHSGEGKSTLSRLWRATGDATLLNDDRVIARADETGRPCLWGTPWHGELEVTSAARGPLAAIFVLRHSPRTRARRLPPAAAAAALFARTFCATWEPDAVAQSLAYLAALATRVPCYDFAFTPDLAACAAIRRRLD